MLRQLLIAFGAFEVVAPRPVIDACERIGLMNPDEANLRSFAPTIARLEGLVFIWVLVRERGVAPYLSRLLAATGLLAILYPKPLIRVSQDFAYENTRELELRPWVVPAARALGLLYVLVAYLGSADHTREFTWS
jgi:hypothetical protein